MQYVLWTVYEKKFIKKVKFKDTFPGMDIKFLFIIVLYN